MQTLNDHIILYDEECPMCKVYTKAFVGTGMLDANGRAPYQQMPAAMCPLVDRERAANEIALVNKKTGEVQYGIHSLFAVIAHAFPVFTGLFRFPPFIWLMSKVYAFISYNRRVIIPATHAVPGTVQPSFHAGYRVMYILFTWFFTSAILTRYAHLLLPVVPLGTAFREYAVCGGQVLVQGLVLSIYAPAKRWQYLGNMMTISFAGALLLLPFILVAHFVLFSPWLYISVFLCIASLMLMEHLRRCRLLSLGSIPTLTWMSYRLLLLIIILPA